MLATLTTEDYALTAPVWRYGPRPADGSDDIRELAPGVVVNWRNRASVARPPISLFVGEEWQRRARCWSAGTNAFFGDEEDDNPRLKPTVLARAQALCRSCPVAEICLTKALETDERYGVWGGTSGRQRDRMRARISAGEKLSDVVRTWLEQL